MGRRLRFLLATTALAAACQLVLDTDRIVVPVERDASAADADAGGGAAHDGGAQSDAAGGMDSGSADSGSADSGSADSAIPDSGGTDSGGSTIEVVINSPAGTAHVNAAVVFEVAVTGANPSKVELLRNGTAFAEMTRRPFSFTWDTAGLAAGSTPVPEGTYAIVARATFDGFANHSSPVTVIVDRTSPTAEARPLPPNDANVGVREPFQIVFSEPMSPDVASELGVGISASCGSVTWSRTLSSDGRTLSLQPIAAVTLPCTATASFGNACRDLAGNPAAPKTVTWTMPVWQQLGDSLSTNAGAYGLAVTAAGEPLVAYEDAPGSPGAHILVKKWSGSSWNTLGAALGSASATSPAVDLDASGAPTVAWVEGTAVPHSLKVAHLASGAWVQYPEAIAQSGTKQADPSHPDVAVASADGSPWLAFQDAATPWSNNLGDCVQSWNAASQSWVWRGCQATGYAGGASLAMEPGDQPLFAYSWLDASGLSVLSWSGNAWASRGGEPSYGLEPSLAVNGHGAVIAWKSTVSSVGKVFAKVWDGADWAPRGTPSAPPPALSFGAARAPSAAVDASLGPVVAWVEPASGYYVKWMNAGQWTLLGDAINRAPLQSNLVYGPSLATDKAGGNLAIAWSQDAALYVMRLNR